MNLELHPATAVGRYPVERYGPRGFRVGGVEFTTSVLLLPDRAEAWPITSVPEITPESLAPVTERHDLQILLLGTGERMLPVPGFLRLALRAAGVALEAMDTGAACRTYNVLLAEDRRVAAALVKLEQ